VKVEFSQARTRRGPTRRSWRGRSRRLSDGGAARTAQFEEWLAGYLGVSGAVGLYSCTTALFLAQKALGIGSGDEVIHHTR